MRLSMLAPPPPLPGEVRQSWGFDPIRIQLPHPPGNIQIQIPPSTVTRIFFTIRINKIATSREPTQKRGTRVSTVKQSTRVRTQRDACYIGWHGMALHCTVLRARELIIITFMQCTGVLKSSDSGTNFLVPKVNLAPQDWFLEIYC